MNTQENRAGQEPKKEADKVILNETIIALTIIEGENLQQLIKAWKRGDSNTVEKLQRVGQLIETLRNEEKKN